MYSIKLEQFEGPLELLLRLVEEEEIDISELSLAKVTDQFISYLDQIEESRPEELADFLVVAARLLLIKSRLLLPSLFIEEEEESLEEQLKVLQEYLRAAKALQRKIGQEDFSFARPKIFLAEPVKASLTSKVTPAILAHQASGILNKLVLYLQLSQQKVKKIVSLKDKLKQINRIISRQGILNFSQLVKDLPDKMEIIVSFLAILELAKERSVVIRQRKLFEEIMITSTNYPPKADPPLAGKSSTNIPITNS